jgi:hypothetical protein
MGHDQPTKPIAPAVATAAPVAIAAATQGQHAAPADRHAERRRPGVAARQPVELARARPGDGQRGPARSRRSPQCATPFRSPSSQNTMPRSWPLVGEAEDERDDRRAAEPIITPTSSRAVELSSRAVEAARRGAGRAARTAARRRGRRPAARRRRCATRRATRRAAGEKQGAEAPTDAPPATPSTYGSARALRVEKLHQRAGQGQRGAGAEAGEHARDRICQKISGERRRRCRSSPRGHPAARARRREAVRARTWRTCMGRGYSPGRRSGMPSQAWRPRPW